MTNDEINNYFLEKSGERVCGNYRNDQISTPKLVRRRKRWGWLLTSLTIIFGASFISSCRRQATMQSSGTRVFNFASQKATSEKEIFPGQENNREKYFHHH
jgi:hypothetical protein